MRSFILVVVTAFVLSVGGLIYFWTQVKGRSRPTGPSRITSTTHPAIRSQPGGGVSDGENVAVKKYDPRTGELASEYFAEKYIPHRGGLVDVKNALARFYMARGQIVELRGKTGTFLTDTPQEGKHKSLTESRTGAPNRGQLNDVTVTIIETVGTPEHPTTQPSMVIAMPNAAFDSENATIVTEAYKDPVTGQMVPADQVPVTIRSPDTNPNGYDFDGRGLKMLWNDRDHRLMSLDVIHGERLVIKNPKTMTQPKSPPAPSTVSSADEKPLPVLRGRAGVGASSESEISNLKSENSPHPNPPPAYREREKRSDVILVADETPTPAPVTRRRRPRPTTAPATTAPTATADEPRIRVPRRRAGTVTEPPITTPKLTTNVEPPIYRAEFYDKVRILQNGAELAHADRMLVDFWMNSGGEDQQPTTQPGSATQPTGHHPHAATQPTTNLATATQPAPATRPTVAAATRPTTRSADEAPIYIYWTGPLHVAPHSEVSLTPRESIITLEGLPVVATQQTSEIQASRLVYRSDDGSLKASPMPITLVTLNSKDAKGDSTIHTTNLEYYAHADPPMAILSGHSTARLPQADGVMMDATWERRCTLRFTELPDGETAIKEADLTGNVHIDHPQMKLDSQRLELAFADPVKAPPKPATHPAIASTEPTSKPSNVAQTNLKQMVASDSVHCVMTDTEGKKQTIDGDRLTLLTENGPDGKPVPHTINADGNVHAVDDSQDLHADHLAVSLAPTTQPTTAPTKVRTASTHPVHDDGMSGNVDLQSLIAQGNVHVVGKEDKTEAFADTMLIDKRLGKTNIKFVGTQPGAKVIEKTNTVIGPIIDIAREDQTMAVEGGGEMIGTQQDHEGEAAKPMHVTWTRNMRVDGKENIVHVFGGVQARTVEADGTVRTVSGDRAQLILADVPSTQPSTRPAKSPTARLATTKPTSRPAGEEPMAQKQIRQVIMYDNARVKSELLDADNLPVQRMNLLSSMLQYDLIPAVGSATQPSLEPTKRITVPVPGTMLVEDYRPPSTQPTAESSATGGMSARGTTAFKWEKSLVYDDATRRAVMTGSVIIDHRDDVYKEDSMHITGATVIADIEQAPPNDTACAKIHHTHNQARGRPEMRVRNVEVHDHVHVNMKNGELIADWIEYNPITRILIAHGTPERDAVFTRNISPEAATQPTRASAGGSQPIRAQVLQWDAGADLPKITQGTGTMRR